MKKINYVKISLDILMALTFALLFNPRVFGGLTFHETAGLAISAAFLTHMCLNFRWVKNVTVKIFNKKLPGKVRFSYLLNLLLLVSMTVIIVSGIFISRVLFPNIAIGDRHMFNELHNLASNAALVLVGIHVGVHWQWLKDVCKKILKIDGQKPRKKAIAAAVIAILLLIGGLQFVSTSIGNQNGGPSGFPSHQQMANGQENQFQNGQNQPPQSGVNPAPNNNSTTGNNVQAPANGSFDGRSEHQGRFGGHDLQRGGTGFISKLGIIGIIAIITQYLEKIILRKKGKDQNISTPNLAKN